MWWTCNIINIYREGGVYKDLHWWWLSICSYHTGAQMHLYCEFIPKLQLSKEQVVCVFTDFLLCIHLGQSMLFGEFDLPALPCFQRTLQHTSSSAARLMSDLINVIYACRAILMLWLLWHLHTEGQGARTTWPHHGRKILLWLFKFLKTAGDAAPLQRESRIENPTDQREKRQIT